MPYSFPTDIPRVAKNWSPDEQRKCTVAANHVLNSNGSEEDAIFACIHAAGRSKKQQNESFATSVMVAFPIPNDVGEQLLSSIQSALPTNAEVQSLDQLHLTLAILGDTNDIPQNRAQITLIVKQFAQYILPVSGKISGVGLFSDVGENGESCLYASFDSPALSDVRTALVDFLLAFGIGVSTEHGFDPHITLAYLPTPKDISSFRVPNLEVTFPSIVLAWGEDWMTIPLENPDQTEDGGGEGGDDSAVTLQRPKKKEKKVVPDAGEPTVLGWATKIL